MGEFNCDIIRIVKEENVKKRIGHIVKNKKVPFSAVAEFGTF